LCTPTPGKARSQTRTTVSHTFSHTNGPHAHLRPESPPIEHRGRALRSPRPHHPASIFAHLLRHRPTSRTHRSPSTPHGARSTQGLPLKLPSSMLHTSAIASCPPPTSLPFPSLLLCSFPRRRRPCVPPPHVKYSVEELGDVVGHDDLDELVIQDAPVAVNVHKVDDLLHHLLADEGL